jgi:AraC-like DNA-binding protein
MLATMKIQLEQIIIPEGQSFRLFKPSLRNHFFWHYHPNYELVFVEASAGIRHVGQHVSSYIESDLVLIGPNIPHLNFDYGLKTEYKQIVVQLKENFLGDAFTNTPEFASLKKLFGKAEMGLSFNGTAKQIVAEKLRAMQSFPAFEQLLVLLDILEILSNTEEVTVLNSTDTSVKSFLNDKIRMASVYEYINGNFNQNPDVNEIAAQVHLSTAAFCRYFKKQTQMTFTDFVNQYRISQAKTLLLQDKNISETSFAVGFESISHFNKVFKKDIGENPSAFKKRYLKG